MIKIRLYKPNDGKAISDFFSKNTTYLRDDKFWMWINRILTEKSIVVVAEDNGRIIAHYAIIPRNIMCCGEEYKAALGVHAVVDPDYKNEISIFQVSSVAYRVAKDQGIDLIYGFPNANYRLIQEKIERWKKIALFNAYECSASDLFPNIISDIRADVVDISNFSELYYLNTILETENHTNEIYFQTSPRYWLNRYALHPQKLYEVLRLYDKDIKGYFVCKKYIKDNRKYLHIVDYIIDNSKTNISDCLGTIFHYYRCISDVYSVWKGDYEFNKAIIKMGFKDIGFDTFFGIKPLSNKAKDSIETLTNFESWRLVMGDSDAF